MATPANVHAWKSPPEWTRSYSWMDYPQGFKALLSVGRTTGFQPSVPPSELDALDEHYPKARLPGAGRALSPSQRLDLIATEIIRQSLVGIHSHEAKKDILTVSKARKLSQREIPVESVDVFSGFNRDVDRQMVDMVTPWDYRGRASQPGGRA